MVPHIEILYASYQTEVFVFLYYIVYTMLNLLAMPFKSNFKYFALNREEDKKLFVKSDIFIPLRNKASFGWVW